jgi:hypothetical protein
MDCFNHDCFIRGIANLLWLGRSHTGEPALIKKRIAPLLLSQSLSSLIRSSEWPLSLSDEQLALPQRYLWPTTLSLSHGLTSTRTGAHCSISSLLTLLSAARLAFHSTPLSTQRLITSTGAVELRSTARLTEYKEAVYLDQSFQQNHRAGVWFLKVWSWTFLMSDFSLFHCLQFGLASVVMLNVS